MSKHLERAVAMMEAARPASGFRPETHEEWMRLLRANEEMGYAMYRDLGLPDKEARDVARKIHGGPVGLVLLRLTFGDEGDE